jgi:hypothetical protein
MYDRRNRLTDQVSDDVRAVLGPVVFDTVIPRNVRLSEAPSHGLPALIYDYRCAGSEAYIALARELIERLPNVREGRMTEIKPLDPNRRPRKPGARPRPQCPARRCRGRRARPPARRERAGSGRMRCRSARMIAASGPAAPPLRRKCARGAGRIDRGARMIQPIVVRPHGHSYQIVAGERRWRAAQRARLHEVPVIVRELTMPRRSRSRWSRISSARISTRSKRRRLCRLIEEFGHTQEALGKLVHKSRSHVANLLRCSICPSRPPDGG